MMNLISTHTRLITGRVKIAKKAGTPEMETRTEV